MIDPPSGIVVNTNNRITDAAFPDHLSFDWGDAYRIIRASKLLGDRSYHTLDSFVEIQTDTVSEAARVLLPLIARDLWYSGEPAAAGSAERRRQVALERLADWNGEMSEHTPEPLIYAAWIRALKRRLVQDELGPLRDLVPAPDPVFIERVYPRRGRRGGLVRRAADHGAGELHRDGAAGARRRADRARGALRAAAGELALGGRAPGAAPAPDARAHAGAAASGQHPPEHAGGRPHAAARADAGGRARSPTSTCTPRGSGRSTTSPIRIRACSSSPPARAGTCCRGTTTTWPRSGGARSTSRCRSTRALARAGASGGDAAAPGGAGAQVRRLSG